MNKELLSMACYGDPKLFKTINDWCCFVEIRINILGAKLQVEGRGDSPESAVANCHANMLGALAELSSLK